MTIERKELTEESSLPFSVIGYGFKYCCDTQEEIDKAIQMMVLEMESSKVTDEDRKKGIPMITGYWMDKKEED